MTGKQNPCQPPFCMPTLMLRFTIFINSSARPFPYNARLSLLSWGAKTSPALGSRHFSVYFEGFDAVFFPFRCGFFGGTVSDGRPSRGGDSDANAQGDEIVPLVLAFSTMSAPKIAVFTYQDAKEVVRLSLRKSGQLRAHVRRGPPPVDAKSVHEGITMAVPFSSAETTPLSMASLLQSYWNRTLMLSP